MKESVTGIFTQYIDGEDKLFIINRQQHLKAFPGYLGFPGGKVDESDKDKSKQIIHELVEDFEPYLITALNRELIEELGFNLSESIEKEIVLGIDHLGVSITPSFNPYRFQNHYFRIQLTPSYQLKISDDAVDAEKEIASSGFYTAAELMAEYNQAEV